MAKNIEEALDEAKAELLSKAYVSDVEVDDSVNEDKPCGYVRKRFNVLHSLPEGDYAFSGKELYIDKKNFTYKWVYSGTQLDVNKSPFKDLVKNNISTIKTQLGVDFVEIRSIDEKTTTGELSAVKGTTASFAETLLIKVWQETPTTIAYKVIS